MDGTQEYLLELAKARGQYLTELFEKYAIRDLKDWVLVEDTTDPHRAVFSFEHRPGFGKHMEILGENETCERDTLAALEREARRFLDRELSPAIYISALEHFGSPTLMKATCHYAMKMEEAHQPATFWARLRWLVKGQ